MQNDFGDCVQSYHLVGVLLLYFHRKNSFLRNLFFGDDYHHLLYEYLAIRLILNHLLLLSVGYFYLLRNLN